MGPPGAGPTAGATAKPEGRPLLLKYAYISVHTCPCHAQPKVCTLRPPPPRPGFCQPAPDLLSLASSQPWHIQVSTHSCPASIFK